MKKVMLIVAISTATILGCSKEEPIEIENASSSASINQSKAHMPLTIGNYWVYDNYSIDTLGNETLNARSDSAFIARDTIISGATYYIVEGDFIAIIAVGNYLRNDNNSVVHFDGSMFFTTNNIGSIYRRDTTNIGWSDHIYMSSWVNPISATVAVPAGTFKAYDKEIEVISTQTNYPWGKRSQHTYYNENVGVVLNQNYYYGSPNVNESRLVRYHLN
jgi:hypothetical protein